MKRMWRKVKGVGDMLRNRLGYINVIDLLRFVWNPVGLKP